MRLGNSHCSGLQPDDVMPSPVNYSSMLGPIGVLNRNVISIGSAVFAGLTSVTGRPTDRQTDHATRSVTVGRVYVRSTGHHIISTAMPHRRQHARLVAAYTCNHNHKLLASASAEIKGSEFW